jgi:tRNA-splicing ligase RtcB (3'-phosphate/5'-hydroxy nucleic acid ligase)
VSAPVVTSTSTSRSISRQHIVERQRIAKREHRIDGIGRWVEHKITTGFLNLAAARRWDDKAPGENSDAPAVVLPLDTELGQQYMAAMELGGVYAYAGRDFVTEQVRAILGAAVVDTVHNHHNYAFREQHGDKDLIVVRKGATPAGPGVRGIIAGSMGTPTVIIHGLASPEAAVGFGSAPHGSGRVMSRTQAAGKRDYRTGPESGPGNAGDAPRGRDGARHRTARRPG